MGENIKELLNEEIAAEIQAISSLDSGSEEKSKAIEDLAKLYRLRIEETKSELDAEDKRSRRTLESEASVRETRLRNLSWTSRSRPMCRMSNISALSLTNR